MPRQKKNSSRTSVPARLFQFKKQLHSFRTKLNTVMSLWNILFSLGALWLVQWVEGDPKISWNVFTVPEKISWNVSTVPDMINSTANTTETPTTGDSKLITFEMSVLLTQVSFLPHDGRQYCSIVSPWSWIASIDARYFNTFILTYNYVTKKSRCKHKN